MLYFIQDSTTLEIKIGYTGKDDVMQRLKNHQTSNPHPLIVLGTCPGEYEDEQRLLRQFSFARVNRENPVNREWFRPVPELLRFIISRAGLAFLTRSYAQVADALLEMEVAEIEPLPDEFIDALSAHGLMFFFKEGGSLHVEPVSRLSAADIRYIKRHRADILAELLRRGSKPLLNLKFGDKVRHPQYGFGTVMSVSGEGQMAKVHIAFMTEGGRTFLLHKVQLELVQEAPREGS